MRPLNALLVFAIFCSSTAFADPALNFFCKSHTYGKSSRLAAIPSTATVNYFAPDISFTDENNKSFDDIFDYQPYSGDDLKVGLLIRAKTETGKVSIYSSLAHIGRLTGSSQILAPSRELSSYLQQNLSNRGLPTSLMAKKDNAILFAGAKADEFIIYDVSTAKSQSLHLQENLANPRYSVGGNFLIFDLLETKNLVLKQVAYDLNTLKVAFMTPASKVDAFSLEYNPARKNWIWLEYSRSTATGDLVESLGSVKSILTKATGALSLPLVYFLNASTLQVLWTELVYKRGDLNNNHRPNIFSKAEAKLVSLEAGASPSTQWPISKNILESLNDDLPQRLMSGGFKAPDSDKIFFSLDQHGGLISLDTKTGAWTLISTFYPCLDPRWAVQGSN